MADQTELDVLMGRMSQSLMAACQRVLYSPRPVPVPVEQTIIPMPEFLGRLSSGGVRFPCALDCGWGHVEHQGTWEMGPIVFRPDEPGSLDKALTEQAERRAAEQRTRIEEAIRAHFAEAHPGREIPTWRA